MTRLWILSDLHIDARPLALHDHPDCDVIVMAGDVSNDLAVTTQFLLDTFSDDERSKMLFVPGNHEYYGIGLDGIVEAMDRLRDATGIAPLVNETVELCGHRFIGSPLWSDLDPALDEHIAMGGGDTRHIPDLNGVDWRAEHVWCRSYLEGTIKPGDVVITHHAPSPEGLWPPMQHSLNYMPYASAYCTDLEDMIGCLEPALWVHGHTHVHHEYQVAQTRVVSNARGRGLAQFFQPGFIVELYEPRPRPLF